MGRKTMTGLLVNGSVKSAGVSFYTRDGMTVVRSSRTRQPRRNTSVQFEARQRLKHATLLWHTMGGMSPMFGQGRQAFGNFVRLAYRLPVVYTPRTGRTSDAQLLLPGLPLSEGSLPGVEQRLGEVDGVPALLTALRRSDLVGSRRVLLVELHQRVEEGRPRLYAERRCVAPREWVEVGEELALAGERFADPMAGWGVVLLQARRRSTQGALTRCTLYRDFTTAEARQKAVESYGGLT